MSVKKIIPCLDVKGGRVVKGINFVGLKDIGDPVICAKEYEKQGADELVFLDIAATQEERATMTELVRKTAEGISVPFCVGGGIRTVSDIGRLLDAGATKVSINTAAVKNPELIKEAAREFGSGRIVVAIDGAFFKDTDVPGWEVLTTGGEGRTGMNVVMWATEVQKLGAGEILLTSMDRDGTKEGFDIAMLKSVSDAVSIPVTASGGGGSIEDFVEVFEKTSVAAALAASIFHYGDLTVGDIKEALRKKGIVVV